MTILDQSVRRRVLIAVLAAAMLSALPLVVSKTPASATNFSGITGATICTGNVADNRTHVIAYSSLQAIMQDAMNWSRVNNYDPTDINTQNETTISATTDVVAQDLDYAGSWCGGVWCCETGPNTGWVGYASCQAPNSANECERWDVYFDTDFTMPATVTQRRGLACHELSHTVGLLHIGGWCTADPPANTSLSDHDRAHINGWGGYNS